MGKKKAMETLVELSDQYDQIRAMNANLSEQRILEIVAQSTGLSIGVVKKRWRLIKSIDWPIVDFLEREVIGINRAMALVEIDLSSEERTEVMIESLKDGITDPNFKEYLMRYVEKKEMGL